MIPDDMPPSGSFYRGSAVPSTSWNPPRRPYPDAYPSGGLANTNTPYPASSVNYSNAAIYTMAGAGPPQLVTASPFMREPVNAPASPFTSRSGGSTQPGSATVYGSRNSSISSSWDIQGRYSPTGSGEDAITSPNLSDDYMENGMDAMKQGSKARDSGKHRPQRRPSNRDEFDGPHQFLQRPPPEVIAMQERELPHLPTNLHVQEQDAILSQVNDRLSQCAYDFVAKYQFPIPLTQDMRPVERPQDREWTEWVYLLKRLATKRRIPARVLYNGQIKQFVTILENSLEMRHAAKHQSRPLKDDRNVLQLISAGIQVAKILKDASAMDYLDRLYVSTEKQILDRTTSRFRS